MLNSLKVEENRLVITLVGFNFYLSYYLEVNGKELKRKRLSLGLSQTELAELLKVKPFTVSRWEADTLPVPKAVEPALEAVKRRMKTHGRADTRT